jgi:medium-chain acyl-[acyl-carrier-protein] hydrolase
MEFAMRQNNWIVNPRPRPQADLRLICFPYAGGGAASFFSWADLLPTNIELIAIQPPGRASRIDEPPINEMDQLVDSLMSVADLLVDKPYVVFGHSLGSRVAFEFMRRCQSAGQRLPQHFIASASRGPHVRSLKEAISDLPDDAFLQELKRLNGTPEEILNNKELMAIYLPLIRADFKISESYHLETDVQFDLPLTVFGGTCDHDVPERHLNSWQDLFTQPLSLHLVNGDHFFIDNNKRGLLAKIGAIFNDCLSQCEQLTRCDSLVKAS